MCPCHYGTNICRNYACNQKVINSVDCRDNRDALQLCMNNTLPVHFQCLCRPDRSRRVLMQSQLITPSAIFSPASPASSRNGRWRKKAIARRIECGESVIVARRCCRIKKWCAWWRETELAPAASTTVGRNWSKTTHLQIDGLLCITD